MVQGGAAGHRAHQAGRHEERILLHREGRLLRGVCRHVAGAQRGGGDSGKRGQPRQRRLFRGARASLLGAARRHREGEDRRRRLGHRSQRVQVHHHEIRRGQCQGIHKIPGRSRVPQAPQSGRERGACQGPGREGLQQRRGDLPPGREGGHVLHPHRGRGRRPGRRQAGGEAGHGEGEGPVLWRARPAEERAPCCDGPGEVEPCQDPHAGSQLLQHAAGLPRGAPQGEREQGVRNEGPGLVQGPFREDQAQGPQHNRCPGVRRLRVGDARRA
mmetsp:Transcript_71598/g.202124  ORF Transcript_71598/g.202124 Transcript_71598/m.202124 type:complete len:272 (+) Transcript_71598:722-1537(+)